MRCSEDRLRSVAPDLSPKFPPVRSRVLGGRHAHRDGVSWFGRAAFLRSLIAAPFASQKMLFVRPEAPLSIPAHARWARRAEIGSRWAAGPRVAARSGLCAGHAQRPGGESPLCNLMEVKHE